MTNLSEEQLLMINNLIYLDEFTEEFEESDALPKTIGEILEEKIDLTQIGANAATSKEEMQQIINLAIADEELCSYVIHNQMHDESTGAIAICIADSYTPDENSDVIVVYAGTGYNEWRDDAIAAAEVSTKQQEQALEFIEELDSAYQDITVTGHSKGGNKAMYVAVLLEKYDEKRVGECYSFDGEGFSPEFCTEYADEIAAKKDEIHSINNYRDFVNPLLICIAGDVRWYVNDQGIHPDEMSIAGYHCPDLIFAHDADGNIQYEFPEKMGQDPAMEALHGFTVYLMEKATRGERVVIMSVIGDVLQRKMGSDESEIRDDILKAYGWDVLFKTVNYLDEYLCELSHRDYIKYLQQKAALIDFIKDALGGGKDVVLTAGIIVVEILDSVGTGGTGGLFETLIDCGLFLNNAYGHDLVVRDFSESTKEQLLSAVQEVEDEPFWNPTKWDCWYRMENWLGILDADCYSDNIHSYYRKLIDINGASEKDINRIFEEVYELDETYMARLEDGKLELINLYTKLQEVCNRINPSYN